MGVTRALLQEVNGNMIDRYDRGAQTLADLEYAPFPDISGGIPELAPTRAQLPQELPQGGPAPSGAIAESSMVSASLFVGAIGIEPTTPTVSR